MADPVQYKISFGSAGIFAGAAASMGVPPINMILGPQSASGPLPIQGRPMTPQDQALLEAKMDQKVESLRGDLKVHATSLEALVKRIDDFANRMTNVPERLAKTEERVAHLPSKGFIVSVTTVSLSLFAALVVFADKLRALVIG